MNRRRFLQTAAATALAASAPRLWAAPTLAQESPRFILVFLRGGYDAANVLVPYTSDFYYESRPHIAVPKPGNGDLGSIPLDGTWALHPALRYSLYPLWQGRQLAFVPFAGTRDLTRSHFETQDHIELGQGEAIKSYNDGFLNRLVTQLGGRAQPLALTPQLPLSLRGAARVANIAPSLADVRAVLPAREQALLQQMWNQTPLGPSVQEGFDVQAISNRDMAAAQNGLGGEKLAAEMLAASRGAPYPGSFVAEAQRLGILMRDSFNIGFVDIGGWDTHVAEAAEDGSQGILANRLSELGQGLAILPTVMGPAWQHTVVVVISEFGRTFRENGNHGTDHGHGTVYWVLGEGIRGGRIAGEQMQLSATTLNQNRDYPVLTDYRDMLGGMFSKMWGLSATRIQRVFPSCRPLDLRLT